MTGKTISEKLLSEKSGRDVRAGDYVEAEVVMMMTRRDGTTDLRGL